MDVGCGTGAYVRRRLLVDLTGRLNASIARAPTGQATVELTPFKRIVGIDPSAKMLEQAREGVKTRLAGLDLSSQIEFVQSPAEDLKPIQDESVDLMIAGMPCP